MDTSLEVHKKIPNRDAERAPLEDKSCKKSNYVCSAELSHRPLSQISPIPSLSSISGTQEGAS